MMLSRNLESSESRKYGTEVRQVDYESSESLKSALTDVHTVVSVIKTPGPEWVTCQIDLFEAAKAVGATRFAPVEWGLGPGANTIFDVFGLKTLMWKACQENGLEVSIMLWQLHKILGNQG